MYTVLVIGPFHDPITKRIIDSAICHEEIKKIIVSNWKNDSIKITTNNKKVIFVQNDSNEVIGYNHFHVQSQAVTIVNAFKIGVETEFVIKVRSDWAYTNFENIIKKHKQDVSKILCSNIYFRPTRIYPYHCSDHLVVTTSKIFLSAWTMLLTRYRNNDINRPYYTNYPAMEQLFADEFLHAKGEHVRNNLTTNITKIMKKHFDIITIDDSTHKDFITKKWNKFI